MNVLRSLLIAAIITGAAYALFSIPQGYSEPVRYSDEISPGTLFVAVFIVMVILELFFQ